MNRIILSLLLVLTASLQVSAQTMAQDAGTVAVPAPSTAKPIWAKLTIIGNTVTSYYATGGLKPTSWTQVAPAATIGFVNDGLLVGLFITSHNGAAVSTGTIDNVSITPAPTYRLADTDIGAPGLMGSANLISGVWSLSGSGADVWGSSDQFNFQPWLIYGDCTIVCRITSLTTTGDSWQKIGLMVRDSYNSGSDYAAFCATLNNGVSFQYRSGANANTDKTSLVVPPASGATSSLIFGYGQGTSTAYVLRP